MLLCCCAIAGYSVHRASGWKRTGRRHRVVKSRHRVVVMSQSEQTLPQPPTVAWVCQCGLVCQANQGRRHTRGRRSSDAIESYHRANPLRRHTPTAPYVWAMLCHMYDFAERRPYAPYAGTWRHMNETWAVVHDLTTCPGYDRTNPQNI